VPFRAPTAQQTMEMVRTRPAPPPRQTAPGVPAALEAVCLRCLAKQPADRYPSAAALADDLRRWLDGQPTQACVAPASAARRRWTFRIRISITISFCLLLIAGLWIGAGSWTLRNGGGDAAHIGVTAPVSAPLAGQFDVRVWESTGAKGADGHPRFVAGNPRRQGVRLNQAVPLTARDWVRIEAELNRPAYLYVVWIDTTGRAWPLYPWRNDDWARRPADEQPRDRLSLPDTPAGMAPLDVGPAGVETLLLLARAAPLTDAEAARLPGLFAGLPPATTPAVGRAAWFENGELATKEKEHDRGHVRLDQAQDGPDVELRLQKLLKEKLRPLFSYTRAVCFDNTGAK
jgi:Domain of unknown function (DUF4384)